MTSTTVGVGRTAAWPARAEATSRRVLRPLPAYVYALLLGLCLMVASGNSHQMGLPLGPERVLVPGALLLLLLDPASWRRRPHLRAVHVFMVLLVAYGALNALWAHTLRPTAGGYALLDRLGVVPFLLFAAAPVAFGDERRRDALLAALTGLGGYLGVLALVEALHLHSLVWPRYIDNPAVGISYGRARGPFVDSGANGQALLMCAVAAGIGCRRFRTREARVAAASVAVLCLGGTVFTLSRAVWIGTALGLFALLLAVKGLRHLLVPVALAGVVTVAALLAVVPQLSANVHQRTADTRSVWDRYNASAAGLRAAEQHPLFGVGWNRFQYVEADYVRQAATYPITEVGIPVHNVALSLLAELGLVGVLLWAGAVVCGVGSALVLRAPAGDLSLWRAGLLVVTVQWVVMAALGPVTNAFPNAVVWLWAGVVLSARMRRPAASPLGLRRDMAAR